MIVSIKGQPCVPHNSKIFLVYFETKESDGVHSSHFPDTKTKLELYYENSGSYTSVYKFM